MKLISILFILASLVICRLYGEAVERPNFVLIVVDDMGYQDIEPFGSKRTSTPFLNRMAQEGMRLTSFYAAPVCSPSRATLMTGCYAKRVGLATGPSYSVLLPGEGWGMHPDELTVAELLKESGYSTACIGKWHLGDQPEFFPTRHGFDYYYGLPYSNDMRREHSDWNFPPLPIMRNEIVLGEVKDQSHLTTAYTEEAVYFIKRNKATPFFLYVPHSMVHGPLDVSERFLGKTDNLFSDCVAEIDWSVGRILETLKAEGLDEKTLVLFTSDNGQGRGSAGPLRGRKGTSYEGGVRMPTIVRWPGVVPEGTESDLVLSTMDVMPTFVSLAGGTVPQDRIIDGHDITDIISGKSDRPVYERFFYYLKGELSAVRSGDWKLFTTGELFNLKTDIGEKYDVSTRYPQVVDELDRHLNDARRDLGNPENCRPHGFVSDPSFLIPRPNGDDSPVKRFKSSDSKKGR